MNGFDDNDDKKFTPLTEYVVTVMMHIGSEDESVTEAKLFVNPVSRDAAARMHQ